MTLVAGFNHLEKYESQWEGLSHILWKIKGIGWYRYTPVAPPPGPGLALVLHPGSPPARDLPWFFTPWKGGNPTQKSQTMTVLTFLGLLYQQ